MPNQPSTPHASRYTSRRAFLRTAVSVPAGMMLAGCMVPIATPNVTSEPAVASESASDSTSESATLLEPTPQCSDDDDEPTLAQTEGPYYTPNTPQRTSFLEEGITGTNLLLSGFVLRPDCSPIDRVLLDFWHCDDAGVYDNTGYRLRGHQFTDEQGRYHLTTIVPALYPGRTRHIHVKVQAPNQPVLTTQLYFPNVAENERDGIFHPSLVVSASETDDGVNTLFNFVLA